MEGAVHATRRFVEDMQRDTVLDKLAFSNAFNTLRRDIMLEAVARYIPELYAFAYANYSQATQLKFNDYIIMSAEGPQQGDPLSALLFCLALQSLLRELAASLRVRYLDDVTLGGAPLIIASDVELIKDKAKQYGLTLNISKCRLITENSKKFSDIEAFKDFRLIRLEDMTLLGAPVIGSQAMEVI